jgi:hypothetical protein
MMKCVTLDEGCAILQDIHVGNCGSHAALDRLLGKHIGRGFIGPLPYLMLTP